MSETEIRALLIQMQGALQKLSEIVAVLVKNDEIIFEILKRDN